MPQDEIEVQVARAQALLPQLSDRVQQLASRHIARTMTDFVGRMSEAFIKFEQIVSEDDDMTEEQADECAEALRDLASMALAQLAIVADIHPPTLVAD